jgi:hypothetical protein
MGAAVCPGPMHFYRRRHDHGRCTSLTQAVNNGAFSGEYTIPTGTTGMQLIVQNSSAAGA